MIKWIEVTDPTSPYVQQALRLYDEAFPLEVREPHEVILRGLELEHARHFCFLIGVDDRDQAVSFATGHYLVGTQVGYIVYIVIDPTVRSEGLGSRTLLEMETQLGKKAEATGKGTLQGILLEMEPVEAEHPESARRLQFFKKNGFEVFSRGQYLQPPLNGGNEFIPLDLLMKMRQSHSFEQKEIILALYKQKYEWVNKIDPEVLKRGITKMKL